MKLLTTVALAGLASAAVPDKSKTFIFSYPHHTYTKTIYGVKADFLTTTHMTIERPHHTHTKTFFTWMGHGAPPTEMPDVPEGDDTDTDSDTDDESTSQKLPTSQTSETTLKTSTLSSSSSVTKAPESSSKAPETSSKAPESSSKAPEKSESSTASQPKVSSVSEGGAAAAGLGVGGLAVAMLLI